MKPDQLRAKALVVMHHAPTKPPYRVEVFNEELDLYYVSGAQWWHIIDLDSGAIVASGRKPL